MKHFRAQLEALLKIFTSKFRKFSNYSDRRVRRGDRALQRLELPCAARTRGRRAVREGFRPPARPPLRRGDRRGTRRGRAARGVWRPRRASDRRAEPRRDREPHADPA